MISLKEKSMADPLLKVDHVTISYNGEPTVRDVSFELKQGEILGIVGESGSGKSTIIRAVMGLLGEEGLVTKGDIRYKGENLTDMSEKKLRRYLETEIGMVFQDCKAALCPVGMNQRVGICAAMIMHPNLLLADEPTSALDVTVQKQVVEELLMMRKEYQTAMILVTHNIGVVRAMADRILVLQNGTVRDYGETKNVLDHSQDPYTQKLMNSVLHLKREHI